MGPGESAMQERIWQLLQSLEAQSSFIYDLGTPQLVETDEVKQLTAFGSQAVPYLIELTESEKPKVVAYIVLVLSKLRDPRALESLNELRARYQGIEPKTEWVYAVIGQCNLAIDALSGTT